METEFLDRMKEALIEQKKEIVNQLIANNSDFKDIVEGMTAKDCIDVASDDVDRKMLEAIGSKDMNRLKLIDSALTRIKYGSCMKCSKKIPHERLEAIPYALLCVDCKSADERRNR